MAIVEEDNWNTFVFKITKFFENVRLLRHDIISDELLSRVPIISQNVWSKLFNVMVHEFCIPHKLDYSTGQHNSVTEPISYDKVSIEVLDKIKEQTEKINLCFDELFLYDFSESPELLIRLNNLRDEFNDIQKLEDYKGG